MDDALTHDADHGDTPQARTRDGAGLHYRLIPGSGPGRFALIHSLAMDHGFWLPVAKRLAKAGDVLVYDCRGHGKSSCLGAPFTVEQFADDLANLLETVGWSDAVIAGASMGGTVAIAFAQRHPGRTRALGLVDTTAWYGPDAPEQWAQRAEKARQDGLAALVGFQKQRWFSAGFMQRHPAVLDKAVATFLANDVDAYGATCRMLGAADLRDGLGRLAVPTRILVGSEDHATPPAMAEAMREAIPNAALQVLDGAAHLTPLERVEDVAAALLSLEATA